MSSHSDTSSNAAASSSTSGRPPASPSVSTDTDRNKRAQSTGSSADADGQDGGTTKRKKTLRACDNCRAKRLKCEFILDRPQGAAPMCHECDKRNLPCELVKPAQMDARKAVKLGLAAPKPPRGSAPPISSVAQQPQPDMTASRLPPESTSGLDMLARCVDRVTETIEPAEVETPSSPSFNSSPPRAFDELQVAQLLAELYPTSDSRVVQRWVRIGNEKMQRPDWPGPTPTESRFTSDLVYALLDHFIDHVLPIWPVITVAEIRSIDLSPVALFSICVITAASRPWPDIIFDEVRAHWQIAIATSDVFIASSPANLQALLIMTLSAEPHGITASSASSALFLRTATAIRMAHDLGLHRPPPRHLSKAERNARMRLWTCTVFVDRWYSAAFGRPALLDLEGCHDYFFSPDSPPDPYLVALYRLSDHLYRATRAVDRGRLSTTTTDEQLEAILSDFDAWTAQLPPSLQFAGPDSSRQGGWLHSLLVAFESIFLQPFASSKSNLPERVHFRPSPARYFAVVTRSQLAIDWILYHGVEILDSTMLAPFLILMANSVQYLASTKTGQLGALSTVEDRLQAWVDAREDGPSGPRQAVYKVALLMYETASAPRRRGGGEGTGSASAAEPDLELLRKNAATSSSPDPLGPLPHRLSSLAVDSSDTKPRMDVDESTLPDKHVTEWLRWSDAFESGELDLLDRELWSQLPDVAYP